MTLYLVRHAQAGTRSHWDGDDQSRPLTTEGRHQAADLVDMLGEVALTQILSSPFKRCIETVAPLAARRYGERPGLQLRVDQSLAEGSPLAAIALVRSLTDTDAVLCSHGDIIPGILDSLVCTDGLELGKDPKCQKGSIWVIDADKAGKHFASAVYVPPPR